jgi:thiamine transport system permease protein
MNGLPGAAVAALLLLILGGALAALVAVAPPDLGAIVADAYLRHVLMFTSLQAGLSCLLSVLLAIPVARALARRTVFPGRTLLLRLFGLPMVMPAIVTVFAMVALYGESGWLHWLMTRIGLSTGGFLYGISGILIAHIFFNMPFAARAFLATLEAVPGESWRLASQLGMNGRQIFRLIEWPALKGSIGSVAGLVFMLCFASFAITLTLGGGPRWASLEAAIFQSLRYDFDLGRAAVLALVQLAISGGLLLALHRLVLPAPVSLGIGRGTARPDAAGQGGILLDAIVILLAALYVGLPVVSVIVSGATGSLGAVLASGATWQAAGMGLAVAFAAMLLATFGALLMIAGSGQLARSGPFQFIASLPLAASPLALGAGLFVLLTRAGGTLEMGLGLVALINGLMGMPYVVRVVAPAFRDSAERHDRLCASLGIAGWNRWRLIDGPLLRRPMGLAMALVAALSLGDLGAIALFGTPNTSTLPLLIYQQLAAYHLDAAAATSLLLVALTFGCFLLIERIVGGSARG